MKKIETILSIGIIFKNEIRCLERCVKSLQTLRETLPCQLVMADTGSEDGSRDIAAKYADAFFDFPWIDDFSAARNAVLDRCTGVWFMWLDADEWLDENITELVEFLENPQNWNRYGSAYLTIRNYGTEAMRDYSDFYTCRLFRNDQGIRFEGAIHEHLSKNAGLGYPFGQTILHHDGYIGFGGEKGKAKRKRNMDLLEKALEQDPDNLLLLIQCIDSSLRAEEYVKRAVEGVENKLPGWERYGPVIYRAAVSASMKQEPEERESCFQRARELFPNSPFIRIDVSYLQFFTYSKAKRYADAIRCGEGYLQAVTEYHNKQIDPKSMVGGSLSMVSSNREAQVRVYLAEAYFQEKQYEKAAAMIDTLDADALEPGIEKVAFSIIMNLHCQSGLDMGDRMLSFWNKISNSAEAKKLLKTFQTLAAHCFTPEKRNAEEKAGYRHSYTAFLPMAGQCEIGNAAALLHETDGHALTKQLSEIENWNQVSIYAIAHALEHGAQYPLPDRTVTIEELDTLASRLRRVKGAAASLLHKAVAEDLSSWPKLAWARSLALSAVLGFDWADETAGAQEMVYSEVEGEQLLRTFARLEEMFISRCYTEEMRQGDAFWMLPPMHRFGCYCAKAFQAKDSGQDEAYIAILREILRIAPQMKQIVQFLFANAEHEQQQARSVELLEMADQIRKVLEQYPADHPAITALKQSEAYQKVAYLIEGTESTAWNEWVQ